MDKKAGTGDLSCKVCGQQFQTGINFLSAAVDVYSDWIDACDAVAKEAADSTQNDQPRSYADLASGAGGRRSPDMQIDRHLVAAVDDQDDGVGDYDD
ncbi:hypothetical protein MMC06_006780 [Schaereria dolodes]|nr:hypothetical protein [Schaereria dolodes]